MRMIRFFAAIVIVFLTLLSPVSAQVEPKTYDPLGAIPRASDGRIEFEFNGYKFAVDEKEFGHYLYMSFEKDFVPTETEKPFLSLGMSGKIDSAAWDKEMLFSSYVPDNFRKDLGESKKQIFDSLLKKAKSIYIDVGWHNIETNKGASVRISISDKFEKVWIQDTARCISLLDKLKKNIPDPEINKNNILYLKQENGFDSQYNSKEPRDSCNILPADKRLFKAKDDLVIFCDSLKGCNRTVLSFDKKMMINNYQRGLDGDGRKKFTVEEIFEPLNKWRERDFNNHQLLLKTILSPIPEGIE